VIRIDDGQPLIDSRDVARLFEKRHDNVLDAIRVEIDRAGSGRTLLDFKECSYQNEKNVTQPCYLLTRTGFLVVAMGFTGDKAAQLRWKVVGHMDSLEGQLTEARMTPPTVPPGGATVLLGALYAQLVDDVASAIAERQQSASPPPETPEASTVDWFPPDKNGPGYVYVTIKSDGTHMAIGETHRVPSKRMRDKDYNDNKGAATLDGVKTWEAEPRHRIIADDRNEAQEMLFEVLKIKGVPSVPGTRGTYQYHQGFIDWFDKLPHRRLTVAELRQESKKVLHWQNQTLFWE
jgi:Rha family phage regulatory protein